MKVNIKKLDPKAVISQYAKPGDAGIDLVAVSKKVTDDYVQYGTGLAIEIPEGYVGLIFPRSSNSKYDLLLCNSVGVIDSGYRGEIGIRYKKIMPDESDIYNSSDGAELNLVVCGDYKVYSVGDKVAQLIIIPYPQIELTEVDELSDTERGAGGFGSTGK